MKEMLLVRPLESQSVLENLLVRQLESKMALEKEMLLARLLE